MSDTDLKKLRWQCRRGMLELDVILIPFLEKFYTTLSQQQKNDFERLLTEADPDLYTWLMGYGECNDPPLAKVIDIIRDKMEITQS